jgi:hypothetical protein
MPNLPAQRVRHHPSLPHKRGLKAARWLARRRCAHSLGQHARAYQATLESDHTVSYTIALAWRDGSGAERRFGPTHISGAYAQRISANGVFVTRQTTIRYLEEDRSARPIVVADTNERTKKDAIARVMAAVFGVAGVALAAVTARQARRR